MSKKTLYLILIAVTSAILIGLIILAVYISINKPIDSTPTTDGQKETTSQTENTTGETVADTTGEVTDQTEDTTGETAETTEATEATETDETKPSGSGNGDGNSGNETEPDNEPDNEPDEEPDSGNDPSGNDKPTPTEPTFPDVYPYNVTYKEYLDMTEDEQIAFYRCFKNHDEYKQWRTAAKKEYDENKIEIEIGEDGKIDLGQITGKK